MQEGSLVRNGWGKQKRPALEPPEEDHLIEHAPAFLHSAISCCGFREYRALL